MEQIILAVQEARSKLSMAPLSNPKKIGQAKLAAMLVKLSADLEAQNEELVATQAAIQKLPEETIVEAQSKPKKAEKEKTKVVRTGPTIKETACELLEKVVGKTDEGRTLGMPYLDIIKEIKAVHGEEVSTSVNCLRWYAGKIRSMYEGYQNYTLPQIRLRATAAPEKE